MLKVKRLELAEICLNQVYKLKGHTHFILILLVAFVLRLIALDQSLWLDEAISARVARDYGFVEIISRFSPSDFHPPLYYLLLKGWTSVFGFTAISVRFPSLVFSLLASLPVYILGGFWAAAMFLFNPLLVYYSQEARMYTMATFFLTAAVYFLIRLTKSKHSNFTKALFLNLMLILSFYSFYGSIFLITAMLLYLLFKKKYKQFFISSLFLLLAIMVISPLLSRQFIYSRGALEAVLNWENVLGKANIKNLLLIPLKFAVGRISFYPKTLYYFAAGSWIVFVFYFVFKSQLLFTVYGLLFFLPVFLALVFSFFSPMLQYFRFLYLLPLLALILNKGASRLWQKLLLLAGFAVFSLLYLLLPQFHREDWKSLASSLPQNKAIYAIPASMDALLYYRPYLKLKIKDLRKLQKLPSSIVVIPYTSEIYGFDYRSILQNKGYKLREKRQFRNLSYEVWQEHK